MVLVVGREVEEMGDVTSINPKMITPQEVIDECQRSVADIEQIFVVVFRKNVPVAFSSSGNVGGLSIAAIVMMDRAQAVLKGQP